MFECDGGGGDGIELGSFKLTVGKICACQLIARRWRSTSQRSNDDDDVDQTQRTPDQHPQVSVAFVFCCFFWALLE